MITHISGGGFLGKVFLKLAAMFFISGFFIASATTAFASAAVTPATGGSSISADTTGGSYTTLTGPIISEGATGDINTGTIILNAPSGFIFDIGGTAPTIRIDCIGGCTTKNDNINNTISGNSVPITSITTTQITKNIAQETNNGVTNSLTWQNIRVRPSIGTPLASGNTTASGTSVISGVDGTTNFGTLTEVAGADNNLLYSVQPSNTTRTAVMSPVVQVQIQDQFGNLTASTASIQLGVGTNPSGGTLTGGAATNATAGTVIFSSLSIDNAGNGYTLVASSGSLTQATSNSFDIAKSDQTITFNALADKNYGDADFNVSATASSTLSVSFNALGNCTISGSTVHITDFGSCTITAQQAGDSNYNAASDVPQTFTITKSTLAISVICSPITDDGTFTVAIDALTVGTDQACGSSITPITLTASNYTVSQIAGTGIDLSNYSSVIGGDCASDGTVTLGTNENKTCTITNSRLPRITVTKVVTNDNGGTKTILDFPLFLNATSVASGVQKITTAGSHTVSETSDSNYTTVISGDCNPDGTITLADGDVKSCTITNDDIQPKLTVIKHVVNDNGGDANADDFTMNISGGPTSITPFLGSESGTLHNVDAGTYSVTETGPDGYAATYLGNCDSSGNVSLDIGDQKDCTLTNDDESPHLIIEVHVTNDNNGSLIASSTLVTVTGSNILPSSSFAGDESGYTISLDANTSYDVTADDVTGYTKTISNECSSTTSSMLNLDESRTCTITFDDIQPKLTITKIIVTDNGGSATITDFPLFVDATSVASGVQTEFNAGAYTISETNLTGYVGVITGDCASDGTITLALADVKSCTITNDDEPGTLTVEKVIVNDNGNIKTFSDFSFSINGGSSVAFESDGDNDVIQDAGTYTITETSVAGYTTTYSNCSAIILTNGGQQTCTITNDDIESTVSGLTWNDKNNDGLKDTGEPAISGLTLALGKVTGAVVGGSTPVEIIALATTDTNGDFIFHNVTPGTYKLFEEQDDEWATVYPQSASSLFTITWIISLQSQQVSLVEDAFFDVTVGDGESITTGTLGNCTSSCPLVDIQFGNHKIATITKTTSVSNGTVNANGISVAYEIPSGATFKGPADWDGVINTPTHMKFFTGPTAIGIGFSVVTSTAIEIGGGDHHIIFDQPVKLTFIGEAGRLIGWSQGGIFHQIITTCNSATSPTLSADSDCSIEVGSDIIVWTRHFSTFITYNQVVNSNSSNTSSGTGGGGGNTPNVVGSNNSSNAAAATTTNTNPAAVTTTSPVAQTSPLAVAIENISTTVNAVTESSQPQANTAVSPELPNPNTLAQALANESIAESIVVNSSQPAGLLGGTTSWIGSNIKSIAGIGILGIIGFLLIVIL